MSIFGRFKRAPAKAPAHIERLQKLLETESGALSEHSRLVIAMGSEDDFHRKHRLRRQLEQVKRAVRKHEVTNEVRRATAHCEQSIKELTEQLAIAESAEKRATKTRDDVAAESALRHERARPVMEEAARSRRDAHLAQEKRIADLQSRLEAAEAKFDDVAASEVALELAEAKEEARLAQFRDPALALRADAVERQCRQADAALEAAEAALAEAVQERKVAELALRLAESDAISNQILLLQAKVMFLTRTLPDSALTKVSRSWGRISPYYADPNRVILGPASERYGTNGVPPSISSDLTDAMLPIDFSVFESEVTDADGGQAPSTSGAVETAA